MTETVVEFGPARIRRLFPHPVVNADSEMVAAVLAGIDDPVVLVHKRPVSVEPLLTMILDSVLGDHRESLITVFPTGWSSRRTDRVLAAATEMVKEVVALSRSQLFVDSSGRSGVTVLEIGADVIRISRDTELVEVLEGCADSELIVTETMAVTGVGGLVHIDSPLQGLADHLQDALAVRGATSRPVHIDDVVSRKFASCLAFDEPSTDTSVRWPAVRSTTVAVVIVGILAFGAVTIRNPPRLEQVVLSGEDMNLVEGRVTARIPSGWNVERITAGPGSKRVRASPPAETDNPADGEFALHVTQSYAPGERLDATAETLRQMVMSKPPEIFADFTAHNESLGRPAVTYQEIRGARVVRWYVVIDGSTRIGIGCQSRAGREQLIESVCGVAVRSAREIPGTE